MVFPENTNWIYEVGLIDDIVVPDVYYTVPDSGFSWPIQATLNGSSSNPRYAHILFCLIYVASKTLILLIKFMSYNKLCHVLMYDMEEPKFFHRKTT